MRQLIARIDDDLHERLRVRAAVEGRSMNSIVVDALAEAAPPLDAKESLRMRMAAAEVLWEPPAPDCEVPSHDEVIITESGAGPALSETLAAERALR